jgi:hypothetical protein
VWIGKESLELLGHDSVPSYIGSTLLPPGPGRVMLRWDAQGLLKADTSWPLTQCSPQTCLSGVGKGGAGPSTLTPTNPFVSSFSLSLQLKGASLFFLVWKNSSPSKFLVKIVGLNP